MKKRLFALLLACAAAFACLFAGCGLTGDGDKDGGGKEEQIEPFTVTFETNGGSPVAAVTSDKKDSFKNILGDKKTEKDGMVFVGWYREAELENEMGANVVLDKDKTVYAKWRDETDAEALTVAVENTRKLAIAAKDNGSVRIGVSNSDYSVIDATLALDDGKITAGSNGSKFYYGGAFYYTSDDEGVKLKEKEENTATAFLYGRTVGTVDYKQHGFYSTFASLAVHRLAEMKGCTFTREGNTFTFIYGGSQSAVQLNWAKENNPWIYFQSGKQFRFTVENKRVVKVEQMPAQATQAYRTTEFFFAGDKNVPEAAKPQENNYKQKWQVVVGGKYALVETLNKAALDQKIYGEQFAQLTEKQTYYTDADMTKEVAFDNDGNAPINGHTELYHPAVNFSDLVVVGYEITTSDLTKEGETTENGVKTTTFIRKDTSVNGTIYITVRPEPHAADDKEFTAEIVDAQSGETLTTRDYTGSKSLEISKSISREFKIKITATKGGYTEYICIKPLPQE